MAIGSAAREGLPQTLKRIIALQCVGYALYNALLYSPLFIGFLEGSFASGAGVTVAEAVLFFVSSGVGCIAVCLLDRHGVNMLRGPVLYGSYALLAAGNILACCLPSPNVGLVLSAAMGLAVAIPLLYWFDIFYCTYREGGGAVCLGVLAVAPLLGRFISAGIEAIGAFPLATLAVIVAGTAGAALCQGVAHKLGGNSCTIAQRAAHPESRPRKYQLSLYIATTIGSFGVTCALSRGMAFAPLAAGSQGTGWLTLVVSVVVASMVLLYAVLHRKGGSTQFGLLIRLALCVSGVVYALAPVVGPRAPELMAALCMGTYLVQGTAMTMISVEIAHERGLSIAAVMPVNYLVFVVTGAVAMTVPGLAGSALPPGEAWSVIGAVACVATAVVIPALPSTSSSAATFALKSLPENQNYEDRAAQAREGIVAKYGLSPRESDVLGLLVQGRTRNQIAEGLGLSSWTVKEYVASLYAKVGVHSAKELMVLVANGEGK